MRDNRIAHYVNFAIYPLLIAVMILAIADGASPVERALALVCALAGALLWVLLDHLLHRFLLTPSSPGHWPLWGRNIPFTGDGHDRIEY
jgi:hypothetical protein